MNNTEIIDNRKNVIMGIIQNYSLNQILPFFQSFLNSNFTNCDVVMFVRNIPSESINYLKNIGVFVFEIPDFYKNVRVINLRWKMYIDYLKENKDKYKLIFSADIRDTFFQKDIFKYYENHEPFLGVAIEEGTLKERTNKKWIIDFVGEEKHKIIQHERIICVGSIWGTYDKFLKFSIIFWEKLKANPHAIEQGIANYMFYYENIFKDCLIKGDNYMFVMTIGKRSNIILDSNQNILNYEGEIASVIHQYDRKPELKKIVIKKHCPELYESIKATIEQKIAKTNVYINKNINVSKYNNMISVILVKNKIYKNKN